MASGSGLNYINPQIEELIRRYWSDHAQAPDLPYYTQGFMDIMGGLSEPERENGMRNLILMGCPLSNPEELEKHVSLIVALQPVCDARFGDSWFRMTATAVILKIPGKLSSLIQIVIVTYYQYADHTDKIRQGNPIQVTQLSINLLSISATLWENNLVNDDALFVQAMRYIFEETHSPEEMKSCILIIAKDCVRVAHQEIEERIEGAYEKEPTHGRSDADEYQRGRLYRGYGVLNEYRWRHWKQCFSNCVWECWNNSGEEEQRADLMDVVRSMGDVHQAGIFSSVQATHSTQA